MTQLIENILKNPFDYLGGAIGVLFCAAIIVRFGKDVWRSIVSDED